MKGLGLDRILMVIQKNQRMGLLNIDLIFLENTTKQTNSQNTSQHKVS